jgi:flagellin
MRELALQSANGSNSSEDRGAMQKEVSALQSELTRISETTSFGGQQLLDGTFGTRSFQVGSESNETIGMSLSSISSRDIGLTGKELGGSATDLTGLAGARTVSAKPYGTDTLDVALDGSVNTVRLADNMSAKDVANAINKVDGISGVGAKSEALLSIVDMETGDSLQLTLGGVQLSDRAYGTNDGTTITSLASDINTDADLKAQGITADGSSGELIITRADGADLEIGSRLTSSNAGDNTAAVNIQGLDSSGVAAGVTGTQINLTATDDTVSNASTFITGSIDFTDAIIDSKHDTVTIEETAGNANITGSEATITVGASKLFSMDSVDIGTEAGSQNALGIIDAALSSIDSQRADLGALQNRFDYTISNLSNIQENVSASRGRIQDTDFAVETANLTKNQILQQAGTSILAQANQIPQAAISLLGG